MKSTQAHPNTKTFQKHRLVKQEALHGDNMKTTVKMEKKRSLNKEYLQTSKKEI